MDNSLPIPESENENRLNNSIKSSTFAADPCSNVTFTPSVKPLKVTDVIILPQESKGDGKPLFTGAVVENEDEFDNLINSQTMSSPHFVLRLSGVMHKRRQGLGRHKDHNWVQRFFTMQGSILCYYDESDPNEADLSRPRKRINLAKEEIYVEKPDINKHRAPTDYLLTVNIYFLGGKRKWELCCTTISQQEHWYSKLSSFDGKPTISSISGENIERIILNGVPGALSPKRSSKQQPHTTAENEGNTVGTVQNASHEVKHEALLLEKNRSSILNRPRTSSVETVEALDGPSTLSLGTKIMLNSMTTIPLFILNVSAYMIRNGSFQTCCIALLFANFALIYSIKMAKSTVHRERKISRSFSSRRSISRQKNIMDRNQSTRKEIIKEFIRKESQENTTTNVTVDDSTDTGNIASDSVNEDAGLPDPFDNALRTGCTFQRATAKHSLAKTIDTHGMASSQAIDGCRSATSDEYISMPHSYWNINSNMFKLRAGPSYSRNKEKRRSGPALFDLYASDMVRSSSMLNNVADDFQIPDNIDGVTKIDTGNVHVPSLIVLNFNIPTEEPSVFGKAEDGETCVLILYLVIAKHTINQLKDMNKASPAVKLLVEWCKKSENDFSMRSRMKAMCLIDDVENSSLPGFISRFNGKPVLITKSSTFTRFPNYIELQVNIHKWAYMPKKGLFSLQPKFPSLAFNVGFTIEGREDDELPEVLLGGVRINKIDINRNEYIDEIDFNR